jgi:hypothetical protein
VLVRACAFVVLLVSFPRAARAQDAFEIQVYDAETAPPGDSGFELHVNSALVGVRQRSPEGELPTERVTHVTLEPHVGLARWCEAGGYLQAAIRPDGTFDYAGVKLRFKMRVPHRLRGLVGLALNLELSSVPPQYEATQLASELRSIIDFEWRRLYAAINPIIGIDFTGVLAGHPQLQPAATVLVRALRGWQLGLEYYGAYGAIDRPAPVAAEVHRLFVVSTFEYKWFGFHVGAGYGFTAGDKWILKSIFSVDLGGGG